jgi:uncharacterized protein
MKSSRIVLKDDLGDDRDAPLKDDLLKDGLLKEDLLKDAQSLYEGADPAHDFTHILRVCDNARYIGENEGADMQVLLLASLLHDAGSGSKLVDKSAESQARRLKIAEDFLMKRCVSEDVMKKVLYAIDVHSFSRGIVPTTLEARVLQDADRLDAMGAIGIARVFITGGSLRREIYNPNDPFCRAREPDDKRWNLDHFYSKLLKLESLMHTRTARRLAKRRGTVMRRYLLDLQKEIENGVRFASAIRD